MPIDLVQLVRETIDVIGAQPPPILEDDAPILQSAEHSNGFYLIGVIGGKDVGKSSLINALAGHAITPVSSHGPGTQQAIAYAHASQVNGLRHLLDREIPAQFRIVPHEISALSRQVLIDLPDIDSHYETSIAITRTMLRHLLFPIWVQSVEKYADQRPQLLLKQVAQGNDPGNFHFVLTKADQAPDEASARDLAADYAARIARTLGLASPPDVAVVSARHVDDFDLPPLRATLSQHKSAERVAQATQAANLQRDRTLLTWIDAQNLTEKIARLARLETEATELLTRRVVGPVLERTLPALADDSSFQMGLVESVATARVRAWPLVGIVHLLVTPLMSLVRMNASPSLRASVGGTDALVAAHLPRDLQSLPETLQSSFAHLHQSHTELSALYGSEKLWETRPAEMAVATLQMQLAAKLDQERTQLRDRLGRTSCLFAPLRWLLTVGAIFWFALGQPITEVLLKIGADETWATLPLLLVQLLSVTALLKNLVFLLVWLLLIALAIRWSAQRRVARLVSKSVRDDPSQGLARVVLDWLENLVQPIVGKREQIASVVEQVEQIRQKLARG